LDASEQSSRSVEPPAEQQRHATRIGRMADEQIGGGEPRETTEAAAEYLM